MKKITMLLMTLLLISGAFAISGIKAGRLYHPNTAATYPTIVQPGDEGVYVEVQLRNNFVYSYENITTQLKAQHPFIAVDDDNFIKEIGPNGQKSIFYKLDVAPDASPGEYLLEHYMKYYYTEIYEDGDTATYEIEAKKSLAISVHYSEEVEITDLGFSPLEILPGEETELQVTVKNTGSVAVNDIGVSYTGLTTTTPVTTTSGIIQEEKVNFVQTETTRKTLPTLQPGQSQEVTFKLQSIRDTTVKAYKMPVTVTYGSETLNQDAILNVKGKPDVRLAGIQIDEDTIYKGQQFSLTIQLENIGTGDAKSVKAEIVSNNVSGMEESYIGTIDVDDTGTAIFDLRDYNVGKRNLNITISYEDEYGNTQDTVHVSTEYEIKAIPPDYTIYFVIVFVFFLIIYLIYRKWRKKKELEQLVS